MKTETIPGLSVIIHTKNAAETVAATLDSVGMAQEILIIDMHSQDETKQIVHRYPKIKFFEVEDVGYADPARNFGIEKAAGPWILVIDADEVLPETLAAKIPELMESEETVCYFLPRKNIIFGAWIEKTGWWPDYQARLFKKGHVSWELGVHKQATVNGVVEQLPATEENALLHYNYRSIKQFIDKLNVYTSITAHEKLDQSIERAAFIEKIDSIQTQAITTFFSQFLQRLFSQNGIADGIHGVSLSLLQSMYELVSLLKQWELSGAPATKNDEDAIVREIAIFQRELSYWIADWHCKHSSGVKKLFWRIKRKLAT